MSETENRDEQIAEMYFDLGMTQAEIGKKFGISPQAVSQHLNKPHILEAYDKRRKAQILRAKIRLAAAANRAVDVQVAYLDAELKPAYEYLRQNAARDILDRSGVKTEAVNEDNQISIVFEQPFECGMPSDSSIETVSEEVDEEQN